MEVKVLKKDKNTMKVELKGESHTLTHLIARTVWKQGGEAAALKEHPVLEEPKVLVKTANPKKTLEKASTSIEKACEDFKKQFKAALKK